MAERQVLFKRVGLAVGAFIIIGLVVALFLCWYYPQTTVIVLRHAEKAVPVPGQSDDALPLLIPEGQARAETLAQVAGRAGVTVIYVTEKLRTQQTANPLATSLGITPTQINKANVDELINDVLASKNRGRVILIVGHSDTVPIIVNRLGGGTVTVGENEFDNLFILTLNRWSATKLIQATYGEPRQCPVC